MKTKNSLANATYTDERTYLHKMQNTNVASPEANGHLGKRDIHSHGLPVRKLRSLE
jgi:hypothetical protein